ncbi:hypothetical protein C8Q73DRAFT_789089 [Cubamyces lactineus]|nr:hypothetical protein C8Q73DRAFT_789089 [Cubamyces lactineus]
MDLEAPVDLFASSLGKSSFRLAPSNLDAMNPFCDGLHLSQGLYLSSVEDVTHLSSYRPSDSPELERTVLTPTTLASAYRRSSFQLAAPPSGCGISQWQPNTSSTALPKANSTFTLESRSLLPGHSLLSDTPSCTGLRDGDSPPINDIQTLSSPSLESPPCPLRPSYDSARRSSSNRSVTVQRLALDLPLSPSGSLSALIHALEDAAPGWYQSLMEHAIPQEVPESPTITSFTPLLPSSQAMPSDIDCDAGSCGLPPDMLYALDALESLSARVRQFPLPGRPPKLLGDIRLSPFQCGSDVESSVTSPSSAQLASPPSTPTEDSHERRPSGGRASLPSYLIGKRSVSSLHTAPGARHISSDRTVYHSEPPHQLAVSNIVNHPKLTKTLGLGAPTPSRLPPPAVPKTPAKHHSSQRAIPQDGGDSPPRTLHKKASTKSLKTPKTPRSLKSIFRQRPPPVPPLPDYDEDESPVRKPPLKYRLSENSAGLRREDRRIDGMSINRHFSSGHVTTGKAVDPDSFLFL